MLIETFWEIIEPLLAGKLSFQPNVVAHNIEYIEN